MFVDREPIGFQADAVVVDNEAASAVAVNHLISHGHRRIGLITDQLTIDTARQRRDGYVRALRESGIVVDQALMRHVLFDSEDALRVAFAELLDAGEPPTALFTAQGLVTIAAVRALRERGLQHRVALVGFDDVALADLLDPPITVIAQDPHLIGATAARRLFARLDGKVGPPRVEVIPTRLVARGSGENRR